MCCENAHQAPAAVNEQTKGAVPKMEAGKLLPWQEGRAQACLKTRFRGVPGGSR